MAELKKERAGRNEKSGRKRSAETSRGKKKAARSRDNDSMTKEREQMEYQESFKDEMIVCITLVIAILLLLSNLNMGGIFQKIFQCFFGLFGILNYGIPFLLFGFVVFAIANKNNPSALHKLYAAGGLFLTIMALIEFFNQFFDGTKKEALCDYFTISMEKRGGGGLIGGLIFRFLSMIVGQAGAVVILFGAAVLFGMFVSEKLLFASLGKKSRRKIEERRERKKLRQEQFEYSFPSEELERPRKKAKTFTLREEEGNRFKEDKDVTFSMEKEPKEHREEEKSKQETETNHGGEDSDKETHSAPFYEEMLNQKFRGQEKKNDPISAAQIPSVQTMPLPAKTGWERAEEFADEEEYEERLSEEKDKTTVKAANSPEASFLWKQEEKRETKKEKPKKRMEKEAVSVKQEESNTNPYLFPPIDLLSQPIINQRGITNEELKATAVKLQNTLSSFGVHVTITNVSCGPTVTRYELQPEQGVKVSKITGLADDIKLNLAAQDIRIEAPIPGKAAVGIEVPNKEVSMVMFRELMESPEFRRERSNISFAVGRDIAGQVVVNDIGKMPHLLIAGATGSGKSVCINTLIMSILYKSRPDDVKLIMIDPKVVELSVYNGIPHLLIPVVTDPKKASGALHWAVQEMTSRYEKFAELGVRNIHGYNKKRKTAEIDQEGQYQKMPRIVIIIDELADLMMAAPGEVEEAICRLAQLARAAGIHLIIATQRPSVNVITGVIKANIPSRIAFSVSSAVDSRTIIDGGGAEKLLGKGDMLFFPSGIPKPIRVQGAFISDKEVSDVVEFILQHNEPSQVHHGMEEQISNSIDTFSIASEEEGKERDDYFIEAGKFIIEKEKASIGMLQRVLKIGFNRAARIMDQLSEAGVVGPEEGTKPRKILMSMEEFEQFLEKEG